MGEVALATHPRSTRARITEVTRKRILDAVALGPAWWAGQLDETSFLERLYDLKSLPSRDDRFPDAAGDIWQHRIRNTDWDDNWIFTDSRFGLAHGSDQEFLRFLAEMLHPLVRGQKEVDELLTEFNDALRPDGYELYVAESVSGRPIFAGRERTSFHGARPDLRLGDRPVLTDHAVLHEYLDRLNDGLARDPAGTIAAAKELVESLCKIILEKSGETYQPGEDLPTLYKRVSGLLRLKADSVPASARGSATTQMILRALVTTVQGLGELRNELGHGHGRSTSSPALTRHAHLAVNSVVTICEFLLDTWDERVKSGEVVLTA